VLGDGACDNLSALRPSHASPERRSPHAPILHHVLSVLGRLTGVIADRSGMQGSGEPTSSPEKSVLFSTVLMIDDFLPRGEAGVLVHVVSIGCIATFVPLVLVFSSVMR